MKKFLLFAIMLIAAAGAGAQEKPKPIVLTWLGQSAFILESPGGTRVLMDPFDEKVGYSMPIAPTVDAVTMSHNHFDHANAGMAKGEPKIIRGLGDNSKWTDTDETVGDIHIKSVSLFHDAAGGRIRGRNTAFIFETGGMRIVHLGDLGHVLTDDQVRKFGKVDVLLVPVGGTFTIDAKEAGAVIEKLKPRLVIPMHFKTEKLKLPIAGVEPFLSGKPRVERLKTYRHEIEALPAETSIIVLEPRPWLPTPP